MSAAPVPKVMPKHLKATYLADQEYLLEETRATGLFYFPGPVLWLIVFGLLGWWTTAWYKGWGGQLSVYSNLLQKLPSSVHRYVFYLFALLILVGLLFLLVRYLRWIRTVYAVTSRRVIVQRGIFGRDFDEIPVLQVRGVDVRQTVGQRILGYGTVRVSSEGGSRLGNEDWKGIPKPFRFQKLIENAAQSAATPSAGPVQWASPKR
ncbi:MAG TPA: PH domain-containing protein [Thermoplasmata archaeon]|nr:PH domain-containing protein [Thermoplasmata archaeon]